MKKLNYRKQKWMVYELVDVIWVDKDTEPYCSKENMKVFDTKDEALNEMERRKNIYLDNIDWLLVGETEDCIKFDDIEDKGWLDIRIIQLA